MSGKKTYRNGRHPSRNGGWVTPVILKESDWERFFGKDVSKEERVNSVRTGIVIAPDWECLEKKIIKRSLSDMERASIGCALARLKAIGEAARNKKVSFQEIKETLHGICNLDDDKVMQAFKDCDESTESLIEVTLHEMGLKKFSGHPPAMIQAAAHRAAHTIGNGKAGPKGIGYRLLFKENVFGLWGSLGLTNLQIWELEGKVASPLVEFAAELLKLIEIENAPGLSTVAKLLRKD